MPELVFLRRGEQVLRFTFDRRRITVGRGDKCDVVIPDPTVSRQHLALSFDGERTTLEDLSGRGTQVGGVALQHGVLTDGADIALGQWRALYRERGPSDQSETGTQVTGTNAVPLAPQTSVYRWQPAQVRIRHGLTETIRRLV